MESLSDLYPQKLIGNQVKVKAIEDGTDGTDLARANPQWQS